MAKPCFVGQRRWRADACGDYMVRDEIGQEMDWATMKVKAVGSGWVGRGCRYLTDAEVVALAIVGLLAIVATEGNSVVSEGQ